MAASKCLCRENHGPCQKLVCDKIRNIDMNFVSSSFISCQTS